MSLSAVAPTEKTENLIYAVFPVSFTFCLASVFLPDPGTWLYIVGAFAPLLSILLYEIGWDETKVKNHHTEALQASSSDLEKDFYNCNLFIRTWETTLQKPPKSRGVLDYLESEYRILVGSVVSSFAARRRLWRQRASYYVLASIPFLTFLPIRLVDVILRENVTAIFQLYCGVPGDLIAWFFLLLVVWAVTTIPVFRLIRGMKNARDHEIEYFLENLITYIYWQTMIATDAVRNHEEYNPNSEKWIVKSELESLDTILTRLDWAMFLERWKRVKSNINDVAVDYFIRNFESRAYELWSQLIYDTRMKRESRQTHLELVWLIYYSEKAKALLEGSAEDLLNYLIEMSKISGSLQSLRDPNAIIDRFPERLLTLEGVDDPSTTDITNALNRVFSNSGGNLHQAMQKLVQELHNPQGVGLHKVKMATLVARYVAELDALGKESFLKGHRAESFLSVFSQLQSDDNRVWVVKDWFQMNEPSEIVKALEKGGWQGILTDSRMHPVVLERIRKFPGENIAEIKALELLEHVYHEYPDVQDKLKAKRKEIEEKLSKL